MEQWLPSRYLAFIASVLVCALAFAGWDLGLGVRLVALASAAAEFERQLGGSAVADADADGSPGRRGEIELSDADVRLGQLPPCGAGDQELALDFLAHGRALKRLPRAMARQLRTQVDFNQSID